MLNILHNENDFFWVINGKIKVGLKIDSNLLEALKDWVDKYPKLIPKLPNYARYILPEQMRIYKYIN